MSAKIVLEHPDFHLAVWALAGHGWAFETRSGKQYARGTANTRGEAWRFAFIARSLIKAVQLGVIPALPPRWTSG